MFVVAARFHFLHQLLVFRSVLHQSLILLGRQLWQFAHECHHVPKQFVVMSDAPGWHACHFHAVLNDPELFGRSEISFASKLRSSWVNAPADLRPFHAGSKMTTAAHLRILARAFRDAPRIIQILRNKNTVRLGS
jgi:hypothetical protein